MMDFVKLVMMWLIPSISSLVGWFFDEGYFFSSLGRGCYLLVVGRCFEPTSG